jgi:hypothetical protein
MARVGIRDLDRERLELSLAELDNGNAADMLIRTKSSANVNGLVI